MKEVLYPLKSYPVVSIVGEKKSTRKPLTLLFPVGEAQMWKNNF